jgi:hypothetical protein
VLPLLAASLGSVHSERRHDAICVTDTHFIQKIVGIMLEVGRGHFHAITFNRSQSFYHYIESRQSGFASCSLTSEKGSRPTEFRGLVVIRTLEN